MVKLEKTSKLDKAFALCDAHVEALQKVANEFWERDDPAPAMAADDCIRDIRKLKEIVSIQDKNLGRFITWFKKSTNEIDDLSFKWLVACEVLDKETMKAIERVAALRRKKGEKNEAS